MGANTRVLVVGADAMEKDLIQQWITEGYLPNLKTLQERSVWGLSETPPRRYSGAVWPSFYTGVGPGTHGQFIHTEFNTDSYEYKGVRPQHDLHPPFWTEASMSDMRIAVVNMPYAPLTVGSSGMQVIEWGVHDMHTEEGRDTGFATQPPGFKNTIINKYGRDPVGPTDIMGRTADEFVEFRNLLVERINNKTEMVCDTLDDGGRDLFMTMFDECHTVGHQCWHLHDPNHPLHNQLKHDIGDPILDVYVAIDAAFGRIVESAGEDAYILFLGSHGMGPLMDGNSILDDVLRQMERVEESAGLGVLYFLGQTWDALPSSVRHFLRPIRLKLGRQIYQSMTSGDRANRQCFAMPTQDQCGGVRVNLIGREAHGQVAPGPEYDAFTEKLIHDLYQLRDGRTDEKAIANIMRSSELEEGNHVGDIADLILQWLIPSITSLKAPNISKINTIYRSRKGDHKPLGMFFAAGPGLDAGALDQAVSIINYAPTIANILGVELANVEGNVISELCTKA